VLTEFLREHYAGFASAFELASSDALRNRISAITSGIGYRIAEIGSRAIGAAAITGMSALAS